MKQTLLLKEEISSVRNRLLNHPVYQRLKTPKDIQFFMEHHVFAVWDFMSLLKSLQVELTCTTVPWYPKGDPQVRHMINEIVLGEETDEVIHGKSHYEWYLEAMEQAGANSQPIKAFIETSQSSSVQTALEICHLPEAVVQFVKFTFDTIQSGKIHCIAAAFTGGRENLIPGMFPNLVAQTQKPELGSFQILCDYLERHIEVDGDDHGPLADKMLASLCDGDPAKQEEAQFTILGALQARDRLWNGILEHM